MHGFKLRSLHPLSLMRLRTLSQPTIVAASRYAARNLKPRFNALRMMGSQGLSILKDSDLRSVALYTLFSLSFDSRILSEFVF